MLQQPSGGRGRGSLAATIAAARAPGQAAAPIEPQDIAKTIRRIEKKLKQVIVVELRVRLAVMGV